DGIRDDLVTGVQTCALPILGRPDAAAAGRLGIVASGPPEALDACMPLFDALGRQTYVVGSDPVSAAAAKIINNLILACAIEALGEGFALARSYKIEKDALYEILTDGLF